MNTGSSKIAKQIAVLGLVLCAVVLSLAYPLRNYLEQRSALAAAVADQHAAEEQVAELRIQQAALSDPNYIRDQAKHRLQYVQPGVTVFVVQAPSLPDAASAAGPTASADNPWYSTLWDTLAAHPGAAVAPNVLDPASSGATGTGTPPTADAPVSGAADPSGAATVPTP